MIMTMLFGVCNSNVFFVPGREGKFGVRISSSWLGSKQF